MQDTVVHLDPQLLAMGVGLLLPLLTGLATKLRAGSATKAVTNAVLSVVTGILATALANPDEGLPLLDTLYAILFAFVSSAATYHSVWKPLNVTPAIQEATKDVGIG